MTKKYFPAEIKFRLKEIVSIFRAMDFENNEIAGIVSMEICSLLNKDKKETSIKVENPQPVSNQRELFINSLMNSK